MFGLGDIGGMMKQVRQMQAKMKETQEALAAMEVEGQAGGGMVTAKANGRGELTGLKIEPEVVDPENVEFLEDLVRAAVRQALEKSQELMKQEMAKVTGGLNLPGMDGLLSGLK
jgi:DNA-binding YbaB/EbfC family protein